MILIARPRSILLGSARGLRGGCWICLGEYCRSAYRSRIEPDNRYLSMGFRIILRKKSNSNTQGEKQ